MKRLVLAALVITTTASCGGKKKEGGEAVKDKPGPGTPVDGSKGAPLAPRADVTSALWAFAPEDAIFGVVIGDGVGARARTVAKTIVDDIAARPFGAPVVEALNEIRKEAGFDPLDDAGWKTIGIDPSKGIAVFIAAGSGKDKDEQPLVVLPVVDRAAFRAKTEGKIETIDGKEVDRHDDDMVCMPVADRYLCAKTVAYIEAAVKTHESKLAAAAKALPTEARGDLELYADVARIPEAADELAELAPLGKIEAAGFSVRLETDGIVVRGWAKGAMDGPVAKGMYAVAPRADFIGRTANSASVVRGHVDPKLLLKDAPPSIPVGDVDLRKDLLDQLTGDIQIVSVGKGLVAGTVALGVEDATKVTAALKGLCSLGKLAIGQEDNPITKLDIGDAGCKGELSFGMLEKMFGFAPPNVPFALVVAGKLLELTIGEVNPALIAGNAADDTASPEARAMLGDQVSYMAWSRALDVDLDALPANLATRVKREPEAALLLDALAWLATNVYEIGVAAAIQADGATVVLRVTTFTGDPADARAGYAAALDKRKSGDRAGYSAALGELAKKFAGSRVGKRAKLDAEGSPVVGPASGLIGAGAAMFLFGREVPRDVEPPALPPGGKAGFGGKKEEAAPSELKPPPAPPPAELKAPQ